MGDMSDLLRAIRDRIDAHSPGRVLLLAPTAMDARWLVRELVDRGSVVGLRALGLEALLQEASTCLSSRSVTQDELRALARESLAHRTEFAEILEFPAYVRVLLDLYAEIERATWAGAVLESAGEAGNERDRVLIDGFRKFRSRIESACPGSAWAGRAPAVLAEHAASIPWIRDCRAILAVGFGNAPEAWVVRLLGILRAERMDPGGATAARRPVRLAMACAGPEVEIAEVARLLRRECGERRSSAVVVPANEVPRWVARLRHRDIPVRAWIERSAEATAAGGAFKALVEACSSRPGREALGRILFGPGLRIWKTVEDEEGIEVSMAEAHAAWRKLRRRSGSLDDWALRVRAAKEAAVVSLRIEAEHSGWEPERLATRETKTRAAHDAVASALARLAKAKTAGDSRDLLEHWGYAGAAAACREDPQEYSAAAAVLGSLGAQRDRPLTEAAPRVLEDLAASSRGAWTDDLAADGPPAVRVLPYESAWIPLPERLHLAGLDRIPAVPRPGPLLSSACRNAIGLETPEDRYLRQSGLLDRLAANGDLTVSWPTRDGSGAALGPGPWAAGLPIAQEPKEIGADAIAAPCESPPCCRMEQAAVTPGSQPGLAHRVAAMIEHESGVVGPFTGDLGVIVKPARPYSVSRLEAYARLPYGYFIERVLGLDELKEAAETLDAMEQGSLLHEVLETAAREFLDAGKAPLDLAAVADRIKARALGLLEDRYRASCGESMPDAVWQGDLGRWRYELEQWWSDWKARLDAGSELGPASVLCAVELAFGPLDLDLGGGRTASFTGKVDRVEWDPRRGVLHVCDYKSGKGQGAKWPEGDARAGVSLQLALYAAVLETMLRAGKVDLRLPPVPAGGSPPRVRALRLEYLKRKDETFQPAAADPDGILAADPETGRPLDHRDAARFLAGRFVDAIEWGWFPLVRRVPRPYGWGPERVAEILRLVPDPELRDARLPELPEPPEPGPGGGPGQAGEGGGA